MAKESASVVKRFQNAKTFTEHLKLALEFHKEPKVLQSYSPLAQPWFLHQNNDKNLDDSSTGGAQPDWGTILQEQIWEAAGLLWGDEVPERHEHLVDQVEEEMDRGRGGKYDFYLLELNYFKRIYRPHPRNQSTIYNDILYISRATHDRHLRDALERLSQILLKRLRPSIRLESPRLPQVIVGRETLREQCRASLLNKQTVNLVGSGGIGKTTLGALIRDRWGAQNTFWYTIQPGFNDSLNSLLFALANFLNKNGSSALWQQLVADDGKIEDLSLAQGLLRADLEDLPELPLLCFDEVGMLHQGYPEQSNPAHQQILSLLQDLPGRVPLLLIGHRVMIEGDVTHTPALLTHQEMGEWLTNIQCPYGPNDLDMLAQYTAGNPRLMNLCVALFLSSDPVVTASLGMAIASLPTAPGLAPVWDRLRGRLSKIENQLILAVAVFRTPAPKDAWVKYEDDAEDAPDLGKVLELMLERQILQEDGTCGVFILPSLREIVYSEMSIEQREQFHMNGAGIYALRGEYTEAAWHLMKADRPELAVELWYPERENEIQRGNAGVALKIFEQISINRLKPRQQKELALTRSILSHHSTNFQSGLKILEQIDWMDNDLISISAFKQWAELLERTGDLDGALEKYDEGIGLLLKLLEQNALIHANKGSIHYQQRSMKHAQKEAAQAMYYAEALQGQVKDALGLYNEAIGHYEKAFNAAEVVNNLYGMGVIEFNQAITLSRQEDFEKAMRKYEGAISRLEMLGLPGQVERVRTNMSAMLMLSGNNEKGINQALEAIKFFEKVGAETWVARNANNIADAFLEDGELDKAEAYARKVIELEDPNTYGYGLFTIGGIYNLREDHLQAIEVLKMSLSQSEKNDDRYLSAFCFQALGESQIGLQNSDKALAVLKEAHVLFSEMNIPSEIEKTQNLIDSLS